MDKLNIGSTHRTVVANELEALVRIGNGTKFIRKNSNSETYVGALSLKRKGLLDAQRTKNGINCELNHSGQRVYDSLLRNYSQYT